MYLVIGVQLARQVPQMLARVIEINNLNRAWKVLFGQIPNPFSSIAHDNLLLRAAPAAPPGLHIKAFTKLFGGLAGLGVGGGIQIADGVTILVTGGLGEDTASLVSLVWAGCPSVLLGRPTVSCFTT